MLLFYSCEDGETVAEDSIPRHMLGMVMIIILCNTYFCSLYNCRIPFSVDLLRDCLKITALYFNSVTFF